MSSHASKFSSTNTRQTKGSNSNVEPGLLARPTPRGPNDVLVTGIEIPGIKAVCTFNLKASVIFASGTSNAKLVILV
ncbi:hypothetical protein Henu6_gp209 [Acinetobacter phage Henu6]|uniref:Uncharacterized protein n=1 Tax=Acinetobacter phage Henu6 TaxID=2500136 RepID=A0A410T5H0_9CAUD|nr:hypothetical protein Henu6_gp209 [Acinetobacter phage Henu6]